MNVYSRIHDIVYPRLSSPVPAFTNPPQSLRETDFANLVPDIPPKLLVGLLLSSKSIIQYKPAWSSDDRFCFPSYLQPCLPDNTWQDLDKYAIIAGRFLTPLQKHSQETQNKPVTQVGIRCCIEHEQYVV